MTDLAAVGPLGQLYLQTFARIADVFADAGDDAVASAKAPACPGWTARDVLAHVAGSCADVLAGRIEGASTSQWTQAQVAASEGQPASAILAEWRPRAHRYAQMLDAFPGWYPDQIVLDLVAHEHDIRGALGRPGAREEDAIGRALDFLARMGHVAATAMAIGPVEVVTDDASWLLGTGRAGGTDAERALADAVASGTPAPASSAPALVQLSAPRFELFRALTGRRSTRQVLALQWVGDPTVALPLFSLPPFQPRADDLLE